MDKAHGDELVHGDELATKHAALAKQIQVEELRRHPNDTMLAKLKREKLRIKDEMLTQH